MLNLESMGRIQVSRGKPIIYQPHFLSYSTTHLTLQGVVGQLLPWGKGSMGSRQSWQSCQTLTPCFPREISHPITLTWRKRTALFTHGGGRGPFFLHVEESNHNCTHAYAFFSHACTQLIFLTQEFHSGGAIYFYHSRFCRFLEFSHVQEVNWARISGWDSFLTFLLLFLITRLGKSVVLIARRVGEETHDFLGCC